MTLGHPRVSAPGCWARAALSPDSLSRFLGHSRSFHFLAHVVEGKSVLSHFGQDRVKRQGLCGLGSHQGRRVSGSPSVTEAQLAEVDCGVIGAVTTLQDPAGAGACSGPGRRGAWRLTITVTGSPRWHSAWLSAPPLEAWRGPQHLQETLVLLSKPRNLELSLLSEALLQVLTLSQWNVPHKLDLSCYL